MATFNILSSCICRDAFGLCEKNEHEVVNFLQSSSPITWFELDDKPKKKLDMEMMKNVATLTNFQKKCIVNDYNKTVLQSYSTKTDFFVTDLVSFAGTGLAKFVNEEEEHYFTFSKWFNNAYTHGLKENLKGRIESVNRFKLIDQKLIDKTVDIYIAWILGQGYLPEEVILVENKKVRSYSEGEFLYYFGQDENRNRINDILDRIYESFEKKLPTAYVVKMPIGVWADINHVWGLIDLHFCKEYYEYLYACFDMITKQKDCQKDINRLRDKYSELFLQKRDMFTKNSIACIQGKQLLKGVSFNNIVGNVLAVKGAPLYYDSTNKNSAGQLPAYLEAKVYDKRAVEVLVRNKTYFVSTDDCIRGFSGNDKKLNSHWKTANASTLVVLKKDSIVIGHNGTPSAAQTQIVQTLENPSALAGKVVTLSVYARVLEFNNENKGGTIAIINANQYGKFYAKADFNNKDWQRITLSARLPVAEELEGVTICLRALAGNKIDAKHAQVEFCDPKFEVGSFATCIEI